MKSEFISPTSRVMSEIWYEVIFFLHSNSYKQPETPFLYGERYPLPRATQTVMHSFRLACQVQCNWLGRLKRRYHSALLIHMWRGSHVPQFISDSADSLGMWDFFIKTLWGQGEWIKGLHAVNCFQVCDFGLLPFSYLILFWKKDV